MERIFDTFREASQEAARICREQGIGASLESRDNRWAVVFDRPLPDPSLPNEALPPAISDPVALENDFLRAQLGQVRHEFASLKATNKDLRSRITLVEQERDLVKPLLVRDAPSPFTRTVLDKLPKANLETILRYEYLCVLNDLGEIDQIAFNDFKGASGLWIAIHNYEKIMTGPQPACVPDHPRPYVEHCPSCGGVVINGYCKCSD